MWLIILDLLNKLQNAFKTGNNSQKYAQNNNPYTSTGICLIKGDPVTLVIHRNSTRIAMHTQFKSHFNYLNNDPFKFKNERI